MLGENAILLTFGVLVAHTAVAFALGWRHAHTHYAAALHRYEQELAVVEAKAAHGERALHELERQYRSLRKSALHTEALLQEARNREWGRL